jgi:spore maturation protein CgeB
VALKFQNKYIIGPVINKINRDFARFVDKCRPDLIFVYRGTHIIRSTLLTIRRRHPSAVLIGYNNDDPFAPGHSYWLWRHFLKSVCEYDLILAYRLHNIEEFKNAGARRVELLRSWYIPERNHPVSLSPEEQEMYGGDVVFVGHYEPDGRIEYLEEVVKRGYKLRLFGPGYDWNPVIAKSPLLKHLHPVKLVWGEDYNKALCGTKIALCFLSKLNRDTYTRRCFEIPVTQTLMLAEYSDDLATLFCEGAEADFFRSKQEFAQKLQRYLQDSQLRQSVAKAGYQRVKDDGHDVISRMKQVIGWVQEIRPAALNMANEAI